jgi:DNA-binding MarR family transcriptional regulator
MSRARAGNRGAPAGGAAADARALETADRLHSAAIHLLRRLRREDSVSGLPAPQLSALSVVVFRGPITLGALAAAEQVRPPSMTRVVRALEAAGLVERNVDSKDRRSFWIQATAAGQRLLADGRLKRVAVLAAEIGQLSEAERQSLDSALDVLERVVGPRHFPVKQ